MPGRKGTVLCLLPGGRIEETENRPLPTMSSSRALIYKAFKHLTHYLSPCPLVSLQDKMEVFLILWQNLQQEVIT